MGHYGKLAVHESKKFLEHLIICFKWVLISMFTGIVIGLISTAFAYGLTYATSFRISHKYIIIVLPLAGLLITFLYELDFTIKIHLLNFAKVILIFCIIQYFDQISGIVMNEPV